MGREVKIHESSKWLEKERWERKKVKKLDFKFITCVCFTVAVHFSFFLLFLLNTQSLAIFFILFSMFVCVL